MNDLQEKMSKWAVQRPEIQKCIQTSMLDQDCMVSVLKSEEFQQQLVDYLVSELGIIGSLSRGTISTRVKETLTEKMIRFQTEKFNASSNSSSNLTEQLQSFFQNLSFEDNPLPKGYPNPKGHPDPKGCPNPKGQTNNWIWILLLIIALVLVVWLATKK